MNLAAARVFVRDIVEAIGGEDDAEGRELVGRFYDSVQAYAIAAVCHERLNEIDDAIACHRQALQARRNAPNVDMGTELELAWLIVSHERTELYDEALQVLQNAHLAFPIQSFKAAASRALIAHSRGDKEAAAKYAQQALEAADMTESQFRNHRELGLVGADHSALVDRLEHIHSGQEND